MSNTMFDLDKRVALVTGATRGIGRAIAEELARAGASVALCSRTAQACEQTAAALRQAGHAVLAQACNVSRREELQRFVDAVLGRWGGIDIVVANAAANPYFGPLTGLPDEAFEKTFTTNVRSIAWLAGMTLPGMAARAARDGRSASFIVIGSIAGLRASSAIGAYGMSKAASHQLVRSLAAEWGPRQVRVNAIAPGLVRTDFARALWEDAARRAEREQATPLRRLGEPRDIAGIAVFLASEAARFVTGQCIVADGGVTIA